MIDLKNVASFIKSTYGTDQFIPLHEPRFVGREKEYLLSCIDSTFVSYVGKFVTELESIICNYTGAKFAIAMNNGTSALHITLVAHNIGINDEVITQALTFVATANAIKYTGANPIFIDSDKNTLGMSVESLRNFLKNKTKVENGKCVNLETGKIIKACIPVHIFGHPAEVDEIVNICNEYGIIVIEDAAESLGSFYKNKHTGTFGQSGVFSFNGNKVVTCGGGGVVITDDQAFAERVRFLSTTAKSPHKWEYFHEEIGYNYRMPNLNAAVACAQMECLDLFLEKKRELAGKYEKFFEEHEISFFKESANAKSNYWLNAIILKDKAERDNTLDYLNRNNIMCRPIWVLLNKLPAFQNAQTVELTNAEWLESRVVNIPSSVII